MKSPLRLFMICIVSRVWMCVVVIDSDAVQMPGGEWEIEMNVTDRTELVPYIKRPLPERES